MTQLFDDGACGIAAQLVIELVGLEFGLKALGELCGGCGGSG